MFNHFEGYNEDDNAYIRLLVYSILAALILLSPRLLILLIENTPDSPGSLYNCHYVIKVLTILGIARLLHIILIIPTTLIVVKLVRREYLAYKSRTAYILPLALLILCFFINEFFVLLPRFNCLL